MRGWLLVVLLVLIAGRVVAEDGGWGIVGTASNDFAFRVYAEIAKKRNAENCLVSPVGLSAGLVMMAGGAGGDTRGQVMHAFGWRTQSPEALNDGFKALLAHLRAVDPKISFDYATSLWVAKQTPVLADFAHACNESYGAPARAADLAQPYTSNTINAWALQQTHGVVPRVVFPQDMEETQHAMLVHVLALTIPWATRFNPAATHGAEFTLTEGGKTAVSLMSRTGSFPYYEDDYLQLVKIPCGSGAGSLYVVLPKAKYTIYDIAPVVFTTKNWAAYRGELETRTGTLALPRLTVGTRATLAGELRELGIADLLSKDDADLPNLSDGRTWLTLCRQRVNVVFAEGGVKAAVPPAEAPTFTMTVDHPFLVLFQLDDTILFLGHVLKPELG